MEKKEYIIYGPKPLYPLEDGTAGEYLYKELKRYAHIATAITDAEHGHTMSYRELLKTTCLLAESFRKNGYGVDTVISICSENSVYFIPPIIAALYLGIVIAPANQSYTEREFIHIYNISKPAIIFCSKQTYPKIIKLKGKLPFVERIIILDGTADLDGAETLQNFISRSVTEDLDIDNFKLPKFDRDDQVAVILCSSGTTGFPKGVMLTHKNLMVRFNHCRDPQCNTADFCKPGNSVLNFLPLYHGFGFMTSLSYLTMGFHLILIQGYKENLFLRSIEKYRVQSTFLIPAVMILLVKNKSLNEYDLKSLVEVGCGSSPLSGEIFAQMTEKFHIQQVRQGYGLTEATLVVTLTPLNNKKIGSTGKLATFVDAKVVDIDTKESLPPNKAGEIYLKGDMVMKGYAGDIEATKNAFDENGWLRTGDVGYYDEDKDFYIVDRIKELIKYKSFQVAPAELEALLIQHPKIKEAAVIGTPDLLAGELPTAFIVTQPDAKISKQEVQDFIKGNVSPEKRLRGGVYFLDVIPRNSTGKIARKELQTMLPKASKL